MATPFTDATAATTAAPGRRVRLDPEDRRERILTAADALFAARSYAEVSTHAIAAAAGTTRTNLHYYFRTKRELYVEVLRRLGSMPEVPAQLSGLPTGPQELDRLIARWLDVLQSNPQTILALVESSRPGADADVAQVFRAGAQAWQDRLLAVLDLADGPDARALLRAFQGMAAVAVSEWLRERTVTREQVHHLLTATLLRIPDATAATS